jgi:hypothetical protein
MIGSYIFKRLADKSAFVVFEKASYRTYVIQTSFMFNFLMNKNIITSTDEFEALNYHNQIELLAQSGIEEELT